MIRPQIIGESLERIKVIGDLSQIFLSIASIEIGRIKKQVEASQLFFEQLWEVYTRLRATSDRVVPKDRRDRALFIAITAEGGFSGDIDEKLISWMLKQYDSKTTDIICIGHHGAIRLAQVGIKVVDYYKLPSSSEQIELKNIVALIEEYRSTTVFYQTYVSLAVQDIKRIELQKAVKQLEPERSARAELISEASYILEPSPEAVISYLESTMLSIALAQMILESRLAQHASRFRAMSVAKDKANETYHDLRLDYSRAKRIVADERMKEIMVGLHKIRAVQEVSL